MRQRKRGQLIKNQRLIELRKKHDLTQAQLGREVDASQSMIARIERGDREPCKETKISLAGFFGVSVEWLFYEQIHDQQSCEYDRQSSA